MIKEYIRKTKLRTQLILVSGVSIIIALIFTLFIAPQITKPFYEKNIYELLRYPTNYISPNSENTNSDIAYTIQDNYRVMTSNNFNKILGNVNINFVLNKTTNNYGKIKLNGNTYYYYKNSFNNSIITTFMNDNYIKTQQTNLNRIIIPILFVIFTISLSLLIVYSNYLLKKISKIKYKIDNINNNDFEHDYSFDIDDEFQLLNVSIEKMRLEINEKENYKNNMFQSISHELKTPISVISSYVEGVEDKIVKQKEAIPIIKDQCLKLENYVDSILKLNKLAFIKDNKKMIHHNTNINKIIKKSIIKFKVIRKDLKIELICDKDYLFIGDEDSWELVIDNILSNFMRYANKKIKIEVKDDLISLYNDGEKIEEKLIDNIFKPYEKGNNGRTGLGLSIVYMTLDMLGYNISVKNIENGVEFIINKIKK